MIFSKTTPI